MSPGKRTQLFAERLDRQRSRHRLYNSTLSRKRRRRVLKELRLNKASSTETREGPTYESSIDMREGVVDVTEIPPPVLAPTATPLENENNPIIYFDLETTGFGKYIYLYSFVIELILSYEKYPNYFDITWTNIFNHTVASHII